MIMNLLSLEMIPQILQKKNLYKKLFIFRKGRLYKLVDLKETLDNLIEISTLAGSEILDVYNGNINVTLKDDLSPLTDADKDQTKL